MAILFLISIFIVPIVSTVPSYAYGPALIIVGVLMMTSLSKLNFDDLSEFVPSSVVIFLMSFSFNIGVGMTAGFVLYPILKIFTNQVKDIKLGMWILFLLSLLFYIFYPY